MLKKIHLAKVFQKVLSVLLLLLGYGEDEGVP